MMCISVQLNYYRVGSDKNLIFLILTTIQNCFQAAAKKLRHATLNCQSNKGKIILYCLFILIRYCEKVIRVFRAFSEAVIIKLG